MSLRELAVEGGVKGSGLLDLLLPEFAKYESPTLWLCPGVVRFRAHCFLRRWTGHLHPNSIL